MILKLHVGRAAACFTELVFQGFGKRDDAGGIELGCRDQERQLRNESALADLIAPIAWLRQAEPGLLLAAAGSGFSVATTGSSSGWRGRAIGLPACGKSTLDRAVEWLEEY